MVGLLDNLSWIFFSNKKTCWDGSDEMEPISNALLWALKGWAGQTGGHLGGSQSLWEEERQDSWWDGERGSKPTMICLCSSYCSPRRQWALPSQFSHESMSYVLPWIWALGVRETLLHLAKYLVLSRCSLNIKLLKMLDKVILISLEILWGICKWLEECFKIGKEPMEYLSKQKKKGCMKK